MVSASSQCTPNRSVRWVWRSIRPGRRVAPPRSITRAPGGDRKAPPDLHDAVAFDPEHHGGNRRSAPAVDQAPGLHDRHGGLRGRRRGEEGKGQAGEEVLHWGRILWEAAVPSPARVPPESSCRLEPRTARPPGPRAPRATRRRRRPPRLQTSRARIRGGRGLRVACRGRRAREAEERRARPGRRARDASNSRFGLRRTPGREQHLAEQLVDGLTMSGGPNSKLIASSRAAASFASRSPRRAFPSAKRIFASSCRRRTASVVCQPAE